MSVGLRRVLLQEKLSAALVIERPYGGAVSHPHSRAKTCGLCLSYGLLVLLQPLVLAQIVQQAAVSVLEVGFLLC